MPLDEFLTKARTLINDSARNPAFKEGEMVSSLPSDKLGRMPFIKETRLLFNEVTTYQKQRKAQMQVNTRGENEGSVHSVQSKTKPGTLPNKNRPHRSGVDELKVKINQHSTPNPQTRRGLNLITTADLYVVRNMEVLIRAQPCMPNASAAVKPVICFQRVCMYEEKTQTTEQKCSNPSR